MGKPSKKNTTAAVARPTSAAQSSLAKSMNATVTKHITPQQLLSYEGRELFIPGSYWGEGQTRRADVEMADADVMYPVKVAEVNLDRKIPGFKERQSMVRVEPQGHLTALVDPEDPMWIGIQLFAEYITADDKRVEDKRIADEQAARAAASQSFANADIAVDDTGVCSCFSVCSCFLLHVAGYVCVCAGSEVSHEDRRRSSQVYEHYGPPQFIKKGKTKTRKTTTCVSS